MSLPSPQTWAKSLSMYVPNAQFSSDVSTETGEYYADLGAPVTADPDGIANDLDVGTAAGTLYAADFAAAYSDSVMGRYGRNVTAVASSTDTDTITFHGRDYLGQKMSETLTLASGTTVAGKKAFASVSHVDYNVQAGITLDLGWGDVLGLPYKTIAILNTTEDGIAGNDEDQEVGMTVTGVDTAGTGTASFVAPFTGYIKGWHGEHTTAMTAAASTMALTVAGVAKTAGDGTAPVAVAGLVFGKDIAKASWVAVNKGDAVVLTAGGEGTGGVSDITMVFVRGRGEFSPAITTDPQTATTGDPRGTYDPHLACDGTRIFTVTGKADRTDLYGVEHYSA